jgi:two-component system response regulator HydG
MQGEAGDGGTNFKAIALDDDPTVLRILERLLSRAGFDVATFTEPSRAFEALAEDSTIELAILDVNMPRMNGIEALRNIKQIAPWLPVVMLTSDENAETAVKALQTGAFNYVLKEHLSDADLVASVMTRAAVVGRIEADSRRLRDRARLADRYERLIGTSKPMQHLFAVLDRAAQLDISLLILGESGTGKELVARAIHDRSDRASGPFVALNCAALPENLIDSELFGHTKGAFTGALRARAGAFERAGGGTLLLDEIGDISPAVQVRLLRVLQEGEVQRVGGDEPIQVDVRVIAATLVDIEAAVEAGDFRPDLFYRLNVMSIELPPLRQRARDIPLLAAHFLQKHCARMKRDQPTLSPDAINALGAYHWPGNVRELENAIQRALALTPGDLIERTVLPKRVAAAGDDAQPVAPDATHPDADISWSNGLPLPEARKLLQERFERTYLERVLTTTHGNLSQAAREAGVDRSNLRRLLGRYELRASDYAAK